MYYNNILWCKKCAMNICLLNVLQRQFDFKFAPNLMFCFKLLQSMRHFGQPISRPTFVAFNTGKEPFLTLLLITLGKVPYCKGITAVWSIRLLMSDGTDSARRILGSAGEIEIQNIISTIQRRSEKLWAASYVWELIFDTTERLWCTCCGISI